MWGLLFLYVAGGGLLSACVHAIVVPASKFLLRYLLPCDMIIIDKYAHIPYRENENDARRASPFNWIVTLLNYRCQRRITLQK